LNLFISSACSNRRAQIKRGDNGGLGTDPKADFVFASFSSRFCDISDARSRSLSSPPLSLRAALRRLTEEI